MLEHYKPLLVVLEKVNLNKINARKSSKFISFIKKVENPEWENIIKTGKPSNQK